MHSPQLSRAWKRLMDTFFWPQGWKGYPLTEGGGTACPQCGADVKVHSFGGTDRWGRSTPYKQVSQCACGWKWEKEGVVRSETRTSHDEMRVSQISRTELVEEGLAPVLTPKWVSAKQYFRDHRKEIADFVVAQGVGDPTEADLASPDALVKMLVSRGFEPACEIRYLPPVPVDGTSEPVKEAASKACPVHPEKDSGTNGACVPVPAAPKPPVSEASIANLASKWGAKLKK